MQRIPSLDGLRRLSSHRFLRRAFAHRNVIEQNSLAHPGNRLILAEPGKRIRWIGGMKEVSESQRPQADGKPSADWVEGLSNFKLRHIHLAHICARPQCERGL